MSIRRTALCVLACLVLPWSGMASIAEINGVKVVPADDAVRIEISKIGDIQFKTFTMSDPDRLVIDCIGAKYDVRSIPQYPDNGIVRNVRTSQYQTDPVMISRVVIDLKQKVDWTITDGATMQVVELTADRGVSPAAAPAVTTAAKKQEAPLAVAAMGPVLPMTTPDEQPAPAKKSEPATQTAEKETAEVSPWVSDQNGPAPMAQEDPRQEEPWVQVEEQQTPDRPVGVVPPEAWVQNYVRGAPAAGGGAATGQRKITLDAQGADIKTVLRTISDFAGVNIVAGKDVKGEVYVHIKDTPWEEALDIMLRAYGYGYREEYGMIRVAEMTQLIKEELEEKTAERKKDELLPLQTRIIFVNNSNAEEMRVALENLVSQRGMISVDEGSNSLIVNDIEKNIEKIETMVRELDKRTYQVDINAKLVEVDVEAVQELGIEWGALNLSASGLSGTGSAVVSEKLALASGTAKFGTVQSWGEFGITLEALEKDNKANIISNPRITTMDNREARILVGKEIPLIVADEAGNPITELTKIGIMLQVTPHVNADRTITLDMHPEVSELQSESTAQGGVIISTSEADTRVIVINGETAVIGGLIKDVESTVHRGVPILKDVPYLGWFFSSKSKSNKKQELVIFVTPTIVD